MDEFDRSPEDISFDLNAEEFSLESILDEYKDFQTEKPAPRPRPAYRSRPVTAELIEAAEIDGANKVQLLRYVTIPMVMPSITICTFLTLTNGFKLFDQNLALTNGGPDKMSEMLALNIYYTFYGRTGWEGVGQAKAVIFFIIVGVIALIQNKLTTSKEVQQ